VSEFVCVCVCVYVSLSCHPSLLTLDDPGVALSPSHTHLQTHVEPTYRADLIELIEIRGLLGDRHPLRDSLSLQRLSNTHSYERVIALQLLLEERVPPNLSEVEQCPVATLVHQHGASAATPFSLPLVIAHQLTYICADPRRPGMFGCVVGVCMYGIYKYVRICECPRYANL
jgi:hypothetical protein